MMTNRHYIFTVLYIESIELCVLAPAYCNVSAVLSSFKAVVDYFILCIIEGGLPGLRIVCVT